MNDDETTIGDAQGERIEVNNSDELHHWAKKLDSTPEQIKDAVQSVGDLAADVEMHLKGSHATTNADQASRADAAGSP